MNKISIEEFLPVRRNMVISKTLDWTDGSPVLISASRSEEIGLEAYEKTMTFILITGRIEMYFEDEEAVQLNALEALTVQAHTLVGVRCLEDARFLMLESK